MKNAGYMRNLVNEYDQKNLDKFEEDHKNTFKTIEEAAEKASNSGLTSIDMSFAISPYEQNQYAKILDSYGYKNEWSINGPNDVQIIRFNVKISW